MRKRRVLALLLALSLVVSGNGMTVLAAEQGADMPVLASQGETLSEEKNLTDVSVAEIPADGGGTEDLTPAGEETEKDGTSGEEEGAAREEKPDFPEDPAETEPTAPKEDNAGQEENGTPAEENGNEAPAEPEEPAENESPEGTEPDGAETLPGDGAENDVQDQESETETEGYISENHVAPEGSLSKMLPETRPYVSRIVTFTDDTGMQITYDANAEQQYDYQVDKNGVLTAVTRKTDVDGESVDTPVDFEGNVELKQPDGGKQYTSIASGVFAGNTKITYVKLPAGVETVGEEAFKGCTSLKGVYLPAGLKKIEESAFEGCTALTQIAVPKTVTQIGDSAFKGDAKLHLIYMKDVVFCDLTSIGAHAFEGCSVLAEFCSDTEFLLPSKLESIGEAAFKGCKTIKKVDLTNTKVASMGASAFQGCSGLTELSPGKMLSLIPERAFEGCRALMTIDFEEGNDMVIDRWAFADCYNLKQLVLPQTIAEVRDYAFQGCTKLTRVEIERYGIKLEDKAFPVGEAPDMVIVAKKGSEGYKYAVLNGCQPDADTYYKYSVEDIGGSRIEDGKFPGGTIWVARESDGKNINELNQKKGVQSGEKCYILHEQTEEQQKGYTFIASSLRCNGQTLERGVDGRYNFTMPEGGVVITAEFRANAPENIKGTKVTVEFSAGEPLQNGRTDEYGYLGVRLKVGQTTRMFLLDEDGETIPAAKISKISSENEKVATVTKGGVITAAGTGGGEAAATRISVTVKGGDGKDIVINRDISVVTADAYAMTLKASVAVGDAFKVEFSGEADGRQFADIRKGFVSTEELEITLKATVYDEAEGISKKLTWTTSNDKVATLVRGTTEEQDPVNTVTVRKGCEGEATITVTAKNAAGAEKEEVTQKFVIRVYQDGFRLGSSAVTLNPNLEAGCTIDLISAYSKKLDGATIKLYQKDSTGTLGTSPFNARYDDKASSSNCKKFVITSNAKEIADGKYEVRVCVNDEKTSENWLPLTITVKREIPKPTIKFNTTKTKYNLFYKDGRATADGSPALITTEITKLGQAKIEKVSLRALTNNRDDKMFEDNFVVDETNSNYASGKIVIKRKEDENGNIGNLKYTSKKQPAVTGYLVVYYEGYDYEDASDTVIPVSATKLKVTIPTCTTAPSYALRETKGTYSAYAGRQNVVFELYDKKSKTKDRVVLGAKYGDTLSVDQNQTDITIAEGPVIQPEGTIGLSFQPDKGKLKLVLKNQNWDLDKDGKERELSYTYTVSVSSAKPTIKTDQSTIILNLNYPEKDASFELVSNPRGVKIDASQTFEPVYTSNNGTEIDKLVVSYKDGKGVVGYSEKVKSGQTPMVKAGTYKFVCEFPKTDWPEELKKVTLTVKVVDKKPTVKLGKGSLQLNLFAYDSSQESGEEQERAEVTFKVSEKPEGYTLAAVGTGSNATEIKCTNNSGAESKFHFTVFEGDPAENLDDLLRVSLKNRSLSAGTYKFSMTVRYFKDNLMVSAKPVSFSVKVYNSRDIGLTVTAKGKINLVNRGGGPNDKNGIVYTPKLKNLNGRITDVKIYDVRSDKEESAYFDIALIEEGKDAGKFFVTPKATLKAVDPPKPPVTPEKPSVSDDTTKPGGTVPDDTPEPGGTVSGNTPGGTVSGNTPSGTVSGNTPGGTVSGNTPGGTVSGNTPGGTVSGNTPGGSASDNTTKPEKPEKPDTPDTPGEGTVEYEYEYADLRYNLDYPVKIWVKVEGYAGAPNGKGGVFTKPIKIKTAQTLPKVTTDKSVLDVYLSSKDYDASFIVKPQEGSVGNLQEAYFAGDDKKAMESFELKSVPQADGTLKVIVHLQEAVGFANDSTNDVKMYVKYKGQGTNTARNATGFTIKIHVN